MDEMSPPKYIFVNGDGNPDHQAAINKYADKRYRVVATAFSPGEPIAKLIVLMFKD